MLPNISNKRNTKRKINPQPQSYWYPIIFNMAFVQKKKTNIWMRRMIAENDPFCVTFQSLVDYDSVTAIEHGRKLEKAMKKRIKTLIPTGWMPKYTKHFSFKQRKVIEKLTVLDIVKDKRNIELMQIANKLEVRIPEKAREKEFWLRMFVLGIKDECAVVKSNCKEEQNNSCQCSDKHKIQDLNNRFQICVLESKFVIDFNAESVIFITKK